MRKAKTILLVDDDEDDQLFFIKALSEIDNATLYTLANNGKEALDTLENSAIPPSLIFMDINMPVMNGIECLAEIIQNPQTRNIPVIFLSTDQSQIEPARKLGAKAFISKTANVKQLREQIERMINLDFITESHIADQTFRTAFQFSASLP